MWSTVQYMTIFFCLFWPKYSKATQNIGEPYLTYPLNMKNFDKKQNKTETETETASPEYWKYVICKSRSSAEFAFLKEIFKNDVFS